MIQTFFKKAAKSKNFIIRIAHNYIKVGEAHQAAAFAYYAFFSIFPLVAFIVSVASFFVNQADAASQVITFIKTYVSFDDRMTRHVLKTFNDMVDQRSQVLIIAPFLFFWAAYRFFNVLIRAINRAWGMAAKSWWELPLTNLMLMGIMVLTILLGTAVPVIGQMSKEWLFNHFGFASWMYNLAVYVGPFVILFMGLTLFYLLAPYRTTRLSEVWMAGLGVTAILFPLEILFVMYLKSFARFNVVYGAFGTMVALLSLIYLFGCIIIFGACFSATQVQLAPSKRKK